MKKKFMNLRLAAAGLAILLALSACGGSQAPAGNGSQPGNSGSAGESGQTPAAPAGPAAGGVLAVGMPYEPANLDPGRDPGGAEKTILYSVVETLVSFNADMELEPTLAAAMPDISEDGLTYTFRLREGVTFHDGEPLTAEAVKHTFDRVRGQTGGNPGAYENLVNALDTVEAIDEHTVRFNLTQPTATFLVNITHPQFGIVSPAAVELLGDGFARQPVGTGPFKVDSWTAGQEIELVKNPTYWRAGLPYLDKVVFKVLPDASTRVISLETGAIDVLLDVPEVDFTRLKESGNLNLYSESTLKSSFFMFSPTQFPFQDKAVREAFALAVDRETISSSILEDMHPAALQASFNPAVWGVTDQVPKLEYDLDRAAAVLDAAGWTVGADGVRSKNGKQLAFTLWTTTDRFPKDKLLTEYVAQTLQELGMDVDVQSMEWGAYREKLYKKEMPAFFFLAGSSTGDVDFVASALFNSQSQFAQGTTPEIERLLADAQVELDPDKRKQLYDEAFTIIYDEKFWIPVYWQSTLTATRAHVNDFSILPSERLTLDLTWLKD